MKILLDECIDRRFARSLAQHEVRTVPQMGWAGIKNGDLMRLAEKNFDVFITVDRNLSFSRMFPNTIFVSLSYGPYRTVSKILFR